MANLIHCITNPISMMQCANAVLALGSKPIMAEHPLEVREITRTSRALLLNLGNISDSRMEAMKISFDEAINCQIPVVIDAVGIACSKLRRDFLLEILEKWTAKGNQRQILVIKGNYSEIKALHSKSYRGKGVDADENLDAESIALTSAELALKYHALVLSSGERDIVTDGEKTFFVNNGNSKMGLITGTGCMLGAICAEMLGRLDDEKTALMTIVYACCFFGIAGELAFEERSDSGKPVGNGSFLIGLLDQISLLDETTVEKRKRVTNE